MLYTGFTTGAGAGEPSPFSAGEVLDVRPPRPERLRAREQSKPLGRLLALPRLIAALTETPASNDDEGDDSLCAPRHLRAPRRLRFRR